MGIGAKMTKHIITKEELKAKFNYDPDTGVFTRKSSSGTRWKAGDVAGTLNLGYVVIKINKKLYGAHRLAWLYMYGKMPETQIDHINGNRADNRIENLREATRAENNQNMAVQKSNKSGYKGVSWNKEKKRWAAQISVNNKQTLIGRFKTKEEAFAAYLKAKEEHHPYAVLSRIGA